MEKIFITFLKFFYRLPKKCTEIVSREFHNVLRSRSKNIKLYQSVTIPEASPLIRSHWRHAVYFNFPWLNELR